MRPRPEPRVGNAIAVLDVRARGVGHTAGAAARVVTAPSVGGVASQ